ncbi:uncharacterized protein LOC122498077 [Leptopilina heterotoma]|uniref:uncharacterized protein LOC122498077 n=1 Tax=Leptopilina heterotoma TaxID=63436 RepID=UPI001CA7B749|nr:uncharacterized protein LOC122498077 [Leptopilina heterotoma]
MFLIWIFIIIEGVQGNVVTRSLKGTTIYAENLGVTKMYHQTWRLILGIDVSGINDHFQQIQENYERSLKMCNRCSEELTLKALNNRIVRLEESKSVLNQMLGVGRRKRGFLNIVGTLSKTLFGTLDETDLTLINHEFDSIYSDNKILADTLGNQTRMIKSWLSSTSHDLQLMKDHSISSVSELNNILNATNANQQNLLISNIITLCSMAISELSEELNLIIDAINDGKHGIVHPQILTPSILIRELKQFEDSSNTKYPIRLITQNYQHIIDISEVSIAITNKRLVYVLRIPILEYEDLQTLHLIPIPIQHANGFIAPIPTHEIILVNTEKSFYIPSDMFALRQCKETNDLRVCKRVQPSYLISEVQSCETNILKNQNKVINDHMCQFSAFQIIEVVYIPLKDPNQFIIIPQKEVELSALCNSQSQTIVITEPSLVYSKTDCILQTPKSILKMHQSMERRTDIIYKKNISYTIDQSDFELLTSQLPTVQDSLHHENLKFLRQNLDLMENSLQKIKNRRRNKTWIEKGTDFITYLGYTSLLIVFLFTMYKIGFCELLSKLIPKNLCIKLFCVNANVNATPVVHYASVASAPEQVMTNDPVIVSKSVRLRT